MDGPEITEPVLVSVHEEVWERAAFPAPRRLPAMRALAYSQLDRYRLSGGFASRPLAVEQSFTAELDGWVLRGIIDRVDPPPSQTGGEQVSSTSERSGSPAPLGNGASGRSRIIDYKTGDPIPASKLRRDLQLALYALGARRALGLAEVDLEIVYLKDASRVVLPAGDDLLAEAESVGSEVAAGVAAGRFEPRPERRRCALCPYRLACPAAL
jgi:DNA helicase II / ATP-dependent DNA helicase PcrA